MIEEKHLIMLPGPTNVPDIVMRAMIKPIISHRGPEFHALHDRVAEGLKYIFETKEEVYVLTSSGTGAVECAISNVTNPGDRVIVPVFGVFSERMEEKIARYGGEVVKIPVEWGDAPTANQIAKAVEREKSAKAIAIVYNETSTGVTVRDLPTIGKIAKENNLLFIVDAVSILGGDYLPVDEWNVDLCVTGSQKCLACPPGLALISVSRKAWATVEKSKRSYYFDLGSFRDFAGKKETPFTPALSLYYALDEALRMIREEGLETRQKRHETCAKAFYAALEALSLKPYSKAHVQSHTVIAVNLPDGIESAKIREVMKKRYNIVIASGAGKIKQRVIRIGCMGIVSKAETLKTIKALENTLADLNYPVTIGAGVEAARKVFQ